MEFTLLVQGVTPIEFWSALAVVFLAALLCLYLFISNLKHVRIIEDTPTSKIRSAAQGFVELEGLAEKHLESTIVSPLSQTECLWYSFKIEESNGTGKSNRWDIIQNGHSPHPIALNDRTGTCIVRLNNAKVYSDKSNTWYGNTKYPTDRASFTDVLLGSRRYRYTEELILEQSSIYALGHFKTTRATDGFTREQAIREIIRDWKKDYSALLERFDRNGDGSIDEKEWKLVRLAAKLESEDLETRLKQEPDIHSMIKPPDNNLPFIVSTRDQKELTSRLKWTYRLSLAGLFATCYGTIWLVINRFYI